jgi:hypothetical protein
MAPVSDAWLDVDSLSAVLLAPVAAAIEARLFLFLPQIDVDLEGSGAVELTGKVSKGSCLAIF